MDRFAVERKSRGPVGHEAPALGNAYRLAEVGLAGRAEVALATLRCVKGDHVVAHGNRRDARADFFHHGATLMTQYRRKQAFGIFAR